MIFISLRDSLSYLLTFIILLLVIAITLTRDCRRLGRKIEGKAQNLHVSLSSADESSHLISNAEFVRKNIYINADLTPAEAKASYELRCARRQRRPMSVGQNSGTRGRPIAADPSSHQDGEATATASSLNPSATVFTPVPANEPSTVAPPGD